MTPLRDPVKNIVYNAAAEDVHRVWVAGRRVVDGGRVLAADERAILAALQAGGERMWPLMRQFDWAGRDADVLSPQTYPEWAYARRQARGDYSITPSRPLSLPMYQSRPSASTII